jgi:cobalt-zinc-cadmium efflux system protein
MSENALETNLDAHDHSNTSTRRLGAAAVLNTGFGVVQVVAGLAIGSVVVLADAVHQAVDALGLITALIAISIARRPPSERWTYGLGKADAVGGFVSATLLVGSIAWIVIESVRRLISPEEVSGLGILVVGLIAIVVNGIGVLLVGGGHGEEAVSLRAARLHLLTDLFGSVVVVAAGGLILLGGPTWIDPVASLGLSAVVLWSTWNLLGSAAGILLDRVPGHLSTATIERQLCAQDNVAGVHHVHVRPLGGGRSSVSAHIVVVDGDQRVHEAQEMLDQLNELMRARHGVTHTTLQLECHDCPDENCAADTDAASS